MKILSDLDLELTKKTQNIQQKTKGKLYKKNIVCKFHKSNQNFIFIENDNFFGTGSFCINFSKHLQ